MSLHMCINGVIPREIKCMSRRNMHILPPKKLCLLCQKRGRVEDGKSRKRMGMKVEDTKTSYMLKRAFSGEVVENILCCEYTHTYFLFCLVAFCATIIKTYLSYHIISYHSLAQTHTHKTVVSLLLKPQNSLYTHKHKYEYRPNGHHAQLALLLCYRFYFHIFTQKITVRVCALRLFV